ncbi:MAG: ABC transporter substrate-binding protein [Proteobacteria bacterium]|nr:ABC transporter substrate-binding protein [Pseudomonadota bacterium]
MKKKIFLALSIALAMIFSFGFNAFAEEGITDTEIHIGSWGPQTGPVAAWGSVPRATEAYFKMINAEGGIHGRKIVFHHFDDAYNPAKTKGGVKQLQESSHSIFAWVAGVGTAPGMAVKDYLAARKVPWISPATGAPFFAVPPQKYVFPTYPLYGDEARILIRYAVKSGKYQRIGVVYQNDEYGKSGLRGAEKELALQGAEMVVKIAQNASDTDMKPVIMKLRKAKPDIVLLWVGPSAMVRILGTAKALKFNPQWMTTSTCSDLPLFYKISRGAIKGIIAAAFTLMPDANDALLLRYKRRVFDRYARKGERWGLFYYAGMAFAEPLVEGLERAGRNLTREKLVKAMESLKDFQGISGKISYQPFDPNLHESRRGQNSVYIIRCLEGAKYEILADWKTAE